jgi:hypothetical protein
MKKQGSRSLASWLCLAAVTLTALAPVQGLRLCVGLDGHVDVGTLADGCVDCPDGAGELTGSRVAELAAGDSCCPCVDVPLISGANVSRSEHSRLALGFADPSAASPPHLALPVWRATRAGVSLPPASRFATPHLRSVVLLI